VRKYFTRGLADSSLALLPSFLPFFLPLSPFPRPSPSWSPASWLLQRCAKSLRKGRASSALRNIKRAHKRDAIAGLKEVPRNLSNYRSDREGPDVLLFAAAAADSPSLPLSLSPSLAPSPSLSTLMFLIRQGLRRLANASRGYGDESRTYGRERVRTNLRPFILSATCISVELRLYAPRELLSKILCTASSMRLTSEYHFALHLFFDLPEVFIV
jgi:hypothetical protein